MGRLGGLSLSEEVRKGRPRGEVVYFLPDAVPDQRHAELLRRCWLRAHRRPSAVGSPSSDPPIVPRRDKTTHGSLNPPLTRSRSWRTPCAPRHKPRGPREGPRAASSFPSATSTGRRSSGTTRP